MGQQPNVPVRIEDLPRPTAHPGPAHRWKPDRPGDMDEPGLVPWGGGFGTPGPDTGYALKLLADRVLPGGDALRSDVVAAVAAVAAARASALGRAPVVSDIDRALELLDGEIEDLEGIAHDPGRLRRLVGSIPVAALTATG